ncbi:MAG: proline dehydrogenase family protein [Chloroflexota bacterium]
MPGSLFGRLVLGVSLRPSVAAAVTKTPLTQGLVHRFVAGETLTEAIEVVRAIERAGMRAALDHLGENTSSRDEADAAADEAIRALDQVASAGFDPYVSVKLTQLGLDVGEHVAVANASRLLARAGALGGFVCIDMEGSTYTTRTIEVFRELRSRFDNVGIVLQACLYRTRQDARDLQELGARIRIVKGAYSEPAHIAYRRKRDTDRNYARLMEYLLLHGTLPAIATHDDALIEQACAFAGEHGIARDRFEFQMLYGVRRDLQQRLVEEGYRVRVYVPYGSQWYPYLTRRLAERPANLLFMAGSLARERRSGVRSS